MSILHTLTLAALLLLCGCAVSTPPLSPGQRALCEAALCGALTPDIIEATRPHTVYMPPATPPPLPRQPIYGTIYGFGPGASSSMYLLNINP